MHSILFALLLAMMPACPTEDSNNCAWAGPRNGNGKGTSFIAFALEGGKAVVVYSDHFVIEE